MANRVDLSMSCTVGVHEDQSECKNTIAKFRIDVEDAAAATLDNYRCEPAKVESIAVKGQRQNRYSVHCSAIPKRINASANEAVSTPKPAPAPQQTRQYAPQTPPTPEKPPEKGI